MCADDVVRFQFWIRNLRVAVGRLLAEAIVLLVFGGEREAHDFAEAEADEDLADAIAE